MHTPAGPDHSLEGRNSTKAKHPFTAVQQRLFLRDWGLFFFFDWIFKTVLYLRFQKASLGCQGESRELGREEEGHWDVYTSWCSLYCLTRQGYCSLFTGKKAEAGRSGMPKSKTCQEAKLGFKQEGKLFKWQPDGRQGVLYPLELFLLECLEPFFLSIKQSLLNHSTMPT